MDMCLSVEAVSPILDLGEFINDRVNAVSGHLFWKHCKDMFIFMIALKSLYIGVPNTVKMS